jgi:hypothetical protein
MSGVGRGVTPLRQISRKPLAAAVSLVLLAFVVLAAVFLLGQFALTRMMAGNATATAEIWMQSAFK